MKISNKKILLLVFVIVVLAGACQSKLQGEAARLPKIGTVTDTPIPTHLVLKTPYFCH